MSLVGGRRHCDVIETQRPERQEELQTVTQKIREWGQRQGKIIKRHVFIQHSILGLQCIFRKKREK